MAEKQLFAAVPPSERIWAVGAVNGQAALLGALHQALWPRLRVGDRLIYLGNYFGDGDQVGRCIDELLLFRRAFIARDGVALDDIVFLRGAAEEMLSKLLQLHFAPNPAEVFDWIVAQGMGGSVRCYGGHVEEARLIMRQGARGISQWTGRLRDAMRARDGHNALMNVLHHAAYTTDERLLFVHAGIDPTRPLPTQSDSFWWAGGRFEAMARPYFGFRRVVRGAARQGDGVVEGTYTLSLDGGSGRGGGLIAVCLDGDGRLVDRIEAG